MSIDLPSAKTVQSTLNLCLMFPWLSERTCIDDEISLYCGNFHLRLFLGLLFLPHSLLSPVRGAEGGKKEKRNSARDICCTAQRDGKATGVCPRHTITSSLYQLDNIVSTRIILELSQFLLRLPLFMSKI